MFLVRAIENPRIIKAWGYTLAPGGLGEYDPEVFEEVELDNLPEDWELWVEKPILDGPSIVRFLRDQFKTSSYAVRRGLISGLLADFVLLDGDESITEAEFEEGISLMKSSLQAQKVVPEATLNKIEKALRDYGQLCWFSFW